MNGTSSSEFNLTLCICSEIIVIICSVASRIWLVESNSWLYDDRLINFWYDLLKGKITFPQLFSIIFTSFLNI